MRLTLDLTDEQGAVLKDALDTTLKSILYQELTVKDALDNFLTQECGENKKEQEELHNLNDYLAKLSPQRILVAEILHTLKEATEKSIIDNISLDDVLNTRKTRRK